MNNGRKLAIMQVFDTPKFIKSVVHLKKEKMKKLIYGVLILALVGNIGCNKKETLLQNDEKMNLKSSGFKNPYDYIGEQHNEILRYYDAIGSKLETRTEFYDAGAIYLNQKYGAGINSSDDSLTAILNNFEPREYGEQLAIFLNEKIINSIQYDYLRSISDIVVDDKKISDILNELLQLEEVVDKDSSLSTDQKKYIFIATSVAKHSTIYWWENTETFLDISKKKCKKYACIALCDVVGVIAGIPLSPVSGGTSLIVFGALASAIGKCCICCPGSCPNTNLC